jgi:hypothetical protein
MAVDPLLPSGPSSDRSATQQPGGHSIHGEYTHFPPGQDTEMCPAHVHSAVGWLMVASPMRRGVRRHLAARVGSALFLLCLTVLFPGHGRPPLCGGNALVLLPRSRRWTPMRTVLPFLAGILCAVIVAAIGVMATGNPPPEQVTVLGTTLQATGGWGLAAATAVGFLLALLLLLPGRLDRAGQTDALEAQVRVLQAAYAQVMASYQQLQVQHQYVLRTLLAPTPAGPPATPSAPSVPGQSPSGAPPEALASRS